MDGNKDKIFSPEDFDKILIEKPQKPGTPKPNNCGKFKKWIKSNKWICFFVVVIVLCIIGYFIFSKSDEEQPVQTETEVIEEVVAIDSVDRASNQPADVQDEANIEEEPEAAQTEHLAEEPKPEVQAPVTNVNPEQTQTNVIESKSVTNDIEAEAMKVIRGDYGIGHERKVKLGAKYQPIQNRVNELKREGVF